MEEHYYHMQLMKVLILCINLGADIDHKSSNGKTPLQVAKDGAWTHVEQLFLFSKLNANVSERIS